jgi:hypothetical protein
MNIRDNVLNRLDLPAALRKFAAIWDVPITSIIDDILAGNSSAITLLKERLSVKRSTLLSKEISRQDGMAVEKFMEYTKKILEENTPIQNQSPYLQTAYEAVMLCCHAVRGGIRIEDAKQFLNAAANDKFPLTLFSLINFCQEMQDMSDLIEHATALGIKDNFAINLINNRKTHNLHELRNQVRTLYQHNNFSSLAAALDIMEPPLNPFDNSLIIPQLEHEEDMLSDDDMSFDNDDDNSLNTVPVEPFLDDSINPILYYYRAIELGSPLALKKLALIYNKSGVEGKRNAYLCLEILAKSGFNQTEFALMVKNGEAMVATANPVLAARFLKDGIKANPYQTSIHDLDDIDEVQDLMRSNVKNPTQLSIIESYFFPIVVYGNQYDPEYV